MRLPHKVPVALAGGGAALVDGPDDQALAAAAVAGGEDAGEAGRVLAGRSFGVAALVALDAELLDQGVFGTEEAHGEEDELARHDLLRLWELLRDEAALVILLPLDLDETHAGKPA